ncbi:NADP-dependent oxidoreductase [Actinosynnema sp. NPDC020468]|uniref:NADP-dependent oxidoreductase n=1 Tax=Actinosynnema sp. NPDC020468 TaxID=3154488 RepID=UPI0033E20D61
MRALRAHERGGPERLVFEEAPDPVPGRGEVLVAVRAAAITFAELTWDLSWQTVDGVDRTPVVPSHEFSGVVDALGPGVADVAVGDEVYGLVPFDRDGAAAGFVAVPVTALARRPRSVSHVEAAALPLAGLTAWQALVDHAGVRSGQRVLVLGGAGGVGSLGVQLATRLGAHVTATARPADVDFVRGLGAAEVAGLAEVAGEYDVVLDAIGGPALDRAFALRPGKLVTLTAPPSAELLASGVDAVFFVVTPDQARLAELAAVVDDGGLRPIVSATYPLAEGRAAFESGGTAGRRPGKVVLVVD